VPAFLEHGPRGHKRGSRTEVDVEKIGSRALAYAAITANEEQQYGGQHQKAQHAPGNGCFGFTRRALTVMDSLSRHESQHDSRDGKKKSHQGQEVEEEERRSEE
jgi:hypothetical protein